MILQKNKNKIISLFYRFTGNVTGSNAYWKKIKTQVQTLIA